MSKIDKDKLKYLGYEYQIRLITQIITDKSFANSIIDILDPNYFEDSWLKVVVSTIKNAKEEYDIIPDMNSLESRILETITVDTLRKQAISVLRKVREGDLNDTLWVQDMAMKFCKQQELKKSIIEINKIISLGDINNYDQCEAILRKALEKGDNKDGGLDVFDNIENVLDVDFRKPIRTGINGLDDIMDGGLSKGELAVILAPFGVGKTTMITKLANTAMLDGHKVLQIFFEDNEKVIQRKHIACWTNIDLNSLSLNQERITEMIGNLKEDHLNRLRLKKFSSDGTTIPMIRQYIRKLIASGFKPDIILLDYIDCVTPSRKFDDVNAGEGNVMRQFETMLSELDMAGWTAVQGNRSSISAEVVEANQMGGSIKKGQIGHFIVSIAKTLDQKEDGTATMAVLKSRFGKDGVIFPNIIFDNSRIQIDMNGSNNIGKSRNEYKDDVDTNNNARVKEIYENKKLRDSLLNN